MTTSGSGLASQFYFSAKNYLNKSVRAYMDYMSEALEEEGRSWKADLDTALGDKLPAEQSAHGRIQDRSRLFPYRRTGDLKGSIDVRVSKVEREKGTRVYASATINSPKADWTSTVGDGAWVGWKEDVLFGKGRGNVASLRDVFADFIKERRNVRRRR